MTRACGTGVGDFAGASVVTAPYRFVYRPMSISSAGIGPGSASVGSVGSLGVVSIGLITSNDVPRFGERPM
jgi:hypothetical protein